MKCERLPTIRFVNGLLLAVVLVLISIWGCGRKTPLKPLRTQVQHETLKTVSGHR